MDKLKALFHKDMRKVYGKLFVNILELGCMVYAIIVFIYSQQYDQATFFLVMFLVLKSQNKE